MLAETVMRLHFQGHILRGKRISAPSLCMTCGSIIRLPIDRRRMMLTYSSLGIDSALHQSGSHSLFLQETCQHFIALWIALRVGICGWDTVRIRPGRRTLGSTVASWLAVMWRAASTWMWFCCIAGKCRCCRMKGMRLFASVPTD